MSEKARNDYLADWHQAAAGEPRIGEGSPKDNNEDEAEWIEFTLTRVLKKHTTQRRVTARSKI